MGRDLNPEPVPVGHQVTLAPIKIRIPGLPKIYSKGIVGNIQNNRTLKTFMHYHLHIFLKVHFQSRFPNLLGAQDPKLVVRPAVLPAVHKAPTGWSRSGFRGPRIPCEP